MEEAIYPHFTVTRTCGADCRLVGAATWTIIIGALAAAQQPIHVLLLLRILYANKT